MNDSPKKKNKYYGLFKCPLCGKKFKQRIDIVVDGKSRSCGCLRTKNLIGKKFGRLTVIEKIDKKKLSIDSHCTLLKCVCTCGKETIVGYHDLMRGHYKSCGCLRTELLSKRNRKDLTNQRFGKLIAKYPSGKTSKKGVYWICQCDCGNTVEVVANQLLKGSTQSCGCLSSKGEATLFMLLNSLDILYEQQKTFIRCINPKTNYQLKFDFYLPDYNCCIEYDGEQHFAYSDSGWNTKENFEQTQQRDEIKNQYCKDNGIHLIRIPYWDYDKLNEDYLRELIEKESGVKIDNC